MHTLLRKYFRQSNILKEKLDDRARISIHLQGIKRNQLYIISNGI